MDGEGNGERPTPGPGTPGRGRRARHRLRVGLRGGRLDATVPTAESLHEEALRRHAAGDLAGALSCMRRVCRLAPGNPVGHNNLGNLLRAAGDTAGALAAYRRAIELAPDWTDALHNAAVTLTSLGAAAPALTLLERALDGAPDDAGVRCEMGNVLLQAQRPEAAAGCFETVRASDGRHAGARCGLAGVALALGHTEAARAHCRAALEYAPGHGAAWLVLSRAGGLAEEDLGPATRALDSADDDEAAACLHFALGHLHDARGDHDRAFRHFQAGNRLTRPAVAFDPARFEAQVSRIIEAFPATLLSGPARAGSDSAAPVLVAGAPRSGTTLVEQILASHPLVDALGEVTFARDLLARLESRTGLPFPEGVQRLDADAATDLAGVYLSAAQAAGATAARFTDKNVTGLLHLGLMALLFPRARFVLCSRDPLDNGLSLFMQKFAPGALPFAYDLAHIGAWLSGARRLLEHWRAVLPGRVHVVAYERLVGDQAGATGALLGHLGLPWEDACLDFHTVRRPVHTASAWQVRQPLYAGSVGRAAAYREHLAPLESALQAGGAGLGD